jgi:hypothetical protein
MASGLAMFYASQFAKPAGALLCSLSSGGQTLAQAEVARDALAKALYERLFSYLVGRINDSIAPKAKGETLGVLDI